MVSLTDMPNTAERARHIHRMARIGWDSLERHRNLRKMLVQAYTGRYYEAHSLKKVKPEPIPVLHWWANAIVANLVYHDPHAMIDSQIPEIRGIARVLAECWDRETEEIGLTQTLRRLTFDGLFGLPVALVGQAGDGEIFCTPISGDKLILDPQATDINGIGFIGDKYVLPLEEMVAELRQAGEVDDAMIEALTLHWDGNWRETVASMSQDDKTHNEVMSLEPMAEVYRLWLPRPRLMVTLPAGDAPVDGFLSMVQYPPNVPDPYITMAFRTVPDNLMPVPLALPVYDLHIAINKQAAKQIVDAEAAKQLGLYPMVSEDDAKRIREAANRDLVGVSDPKAVTEFRYGGADPDAWRTLAQLMDQFNRIGNNPEQLSGMPSGDPTATQAQITAGAIGVGLEDLRSIVQQFGRKIGQAIAWYLWYGDKERVVSFRENGLDMTAMFGAAEKQGIDFEQFDFDVDLYSRAPMSPAARAAALKDAIVSVTLPLAQLGAQQGDRINVAKINQDVLKGMGVKDADEYVQAAMPQQIQPVPMPGGQPGPQGQGGQPMRGPQGMQGPQGEALKRQSQSQEQAV